MCGLPFISAIPRPCFSQLSSPPRRAAVPFCTPQDEVHHQSLVSCRWLTSMRPCPCSEAALHLARVLVFPQLHCLPKLNPRSSSKFSSLSSKCFAAAGTPMSAAQMELSAWTF